MKIMQSLSLSILGSSLLAFIAFPAGAATVFTDDFESYTPGTGNFTPAGTSWYDFYNAITVADEASSTAFGSPNQFMILNVGSNFFRSDSLSQSASGLATYSFDFYDSSTAASGPDGVRFGIGNGDLNSDKGYTGWFINDGVLSTAENTALASGTLPTLDEDKVYTAFVVYNGSASTQSIGGSGGSVAAGQSALYFYDQAGSTLLDAGRFSHTESVTPSGFLIRNFSSADTVLYVDNIAMEDTLLVIPEPASLVLVLLGTMVVGLGRLRRK